MFQIQKTKVFYYYLQSYTKAKGELRKPLNWTNSAHFLFSKLGIVTTTAAPAFNQFF